MAVFRWFEQIIDKISEYLPDEDDLTEDEIRYEEGKKRVYELHASNDVLFYAEQAWTEEGKGRLYGEMAKGNLHSGDCIELLDVQGILLMDAVADRVVPEREEDDGAASDSARIYIDLRDDILSEDEDIFVKTFYVKEKDSTNV